MSRHPATGAAVLLAAIWIAAAPTVHGQSDPSLFTNVINIPPEVVSGSAAAGTQLNLLDGGMLPRDFDARFGSEINVYGGVIGSNFDALSGSVVNLRGGAVGTAFHVRSGSDVEFFGGEFHLNGAPYANSTITLADSDVLTGTLADGSSFILSPSGADVVENVRLTATLLPPLSTMPETIDGPSTMRPSGLRAGQSLTVEAGGFLGESFAVVDASLTFAGGSVGDGLRVAGGKVIVQQGAVGRILAYDGGRVTIGGGSVGDSSRVFSGGVLDIEGGSIGKTLVTSAGATVNLTSGTIGNTFRPTDSEVNIQGGFVGALFEPRGGVVNLSGGIIGGAFRSYGSRVNISGGAILDGGIAESGSVILQSGGAIGGRFTVNSDATMRVSGGTIASGFRARGGSDTQLVGGEFYLNGAGFSGSAVTVTDQDVLAGTLADGTVFVFSPFAGDSLVGATLESSALPQAIMTPFLVNSASSVVPTGLRPDQSLTLSGRAKLGDNFAALNATLSVAGGTIGESLEVVGSTISITGGTIGDGFGVHGPSVVDIDGGAVGRFFGVNAGATLNMNGGKIGAGFTAAQGSIVNIHGGEFGDSFAAGAGSQINFFGSNFKIDGAPLQFNGTGNTVVVSTRNVTVTGELTDGTSFSHYLFTRAGTNGFDYFSPDSIVTVTRTDAVPEVSSMALIAAAIGACVQQRFRSRRKASVDPGRL